MKSLTEMNYYKYHIMFAYVQMFAYLRIKKNKISSTLQTKIVFPYFSFVNPFFIYPVKYLINFVLSLNLYYWHL